MPLLEWLMPSWCYAELNMADVFISYKREDSAVAVALGTALQKVGFSVWWDASIKAGEYFDERLQREIAESRAVVVLWSRRSIKSRWVRAEALNGFTRELLVSVLIDDVEIGLPFNTVQAADMRGWNLVDSHPGLTNLVDGIRDKLGWRGTAEESVQLTRAEEFEWATGYPDLDGIIGKFRAGSLNVIASRPAMGKSALALGIALNAANLLRTDKTCGSVVFFSLESSKDEVALRMLSLGGGVSAYRLRRSKITKEEYGRLADVAEDFNNLPLSIDDCGAQSIDKIEEACLTVGPSGPAALVFLDRFSMIDGSTAQTAKKVAMRLKALAKTLRAPVVVTTEVSRRVESRSDKRPSLGDIDDSLANLADCVLGVYRERVYLEREEPTEGTQEHLAWMVQLDRVLDVAEVIVLKQRDGPIGRVRMTFDADTMAFR